MGSIHEFVPQGQWNTPHGIAEVIEQTGFGIVGGVIDKTGEGYLMRYLLAAPKMLAALKECQEDYRELMRAGPTEDEAEEIEEMLSVVDAAIAEAEGAD